MLTAVVISLVQNADSPKDAQAAEEQPATQESGSSGESGAITDAEGETASTSDVNASMDKAFVRLLFLTLLAPICPDRALPHHIPPF